jgi:hypothetical protein
VHNELDIVFSDGKVKHLIGPPIRENNFLNNPLIEHIKVVLHESLEVHLLLRELTLIVIECAVLALHPINHG